MKFKVVSVHGVPRSGTSWVGQIFDSHPDVAYRHQPLFAYRFKDYLNQSSTRQEVVQFLYSLHELRDDEFILDKTRREGAEEFWQKAHKSDTPSHLVMKMVRYHHLLPLFINDIDGIKIVAIIRHPCAVINSWLQAPKEFRPGWDAREEWRDAPKKNAGRIEEYNGFEKWKEAARLFIELEQKYPDALRIIQYENLVRFRENEIKKIFDFVGLSLPKQTVDFVRLSHSRHDKDPYAVFKDPDNHQRWKIELDPFIANEIITDLQHTDLERFLT